MNRAAAALWMRIESLLLAIVMSVAIQGTSRAATLSEKDTVALARVCAPAVNADVLAAIARVEGRFDPLALRNNSEHLSVTFSSVAAGLRKAEKWVSQGDSVDLGLMQINSENLAKLGLTVETALDPCRSLNAAAHVLSAAYKQGSTAAERQAALLIALSRYNTGRTLAGVWNGYAGQVLTAQSDTKQTNSQSLNNAEQQPMFWDVWAVASAARRDGAGWLIGSQDTHEFLIGAGAQPAAGEPYAVSQGPGTAPGK